MRRQLAERLWYPIWDAGLKLGHAVRTRKEALALAADDLDTATSLLDARLVAGDADAQPPTGRRAEAPVAEPADRWLPRSGRPWPSATTGPGEVAFLLEPDLKEGRGGLRDVHALHWAEAARRILLDGDHEALAAAHETLLSTPGSRCTAGRARRSTGCSSRSRTASPRPSATPTPTP